MRDVAVAQFTSSSGPDRAVVQLGFVPDYVVIYADIGGTNPNIVKWFNPATLDQVPDADGDADDALLLTGATGVVTVIDDAVAAHAGGSEITAADADEYFKRDGSNSVDGDVSSAGVEVKAAAQVADGINVVVAYRNDI